MVLGLVWTFLIVSFYFSALRYLMSTLQSIVTVNGAVHDHFYGNTGYCAIYPLYR
jgi:hypothetical protein